MRQAVALLLLCSLSVHCAGRLGVVANWWLQRDYIARELCVNRAKPQLQCNGKCHLAKQLKAVEQAERKQQPDSRQAFQEITLFCAPLAGLAPPVPVLYWAAPHYAVFRASTYHLDQPGPDHPPARA